MRNLNNIKEFLNELENDKSIIFNYLKVSNFERELFLSISEYFTEYYNYELKGLTRSHYVKLLQVIEPKGNSKKLIEKAFSINSMITKRTVNMGYGGHSEMKVIKNYKLELFIFTLNEYISLYEE